MPKAKKPEFIVQVYRAGPEKGPPVFTAKVEADDPAEAVVFVADEIQANNQPGPDEETKKKEDEELSLLVAALQKQGGADPVLESRITQLEHAFQLTTQMIGSLQKQVTKITDPDFEWTPEDAE